MKLEINHRKINEEKITKKLSGMLPKKKKTQNKKTTTQWVSNEIKEEKHTTRPTTLKTQPYKMDGRSSLCGSAVNEL